MTTDHKQAIAAKLEYVRTRSAGLAKRAGLDHQAEDIASTAIVIALRSADSFDGKNLTGWLLAIIEGVIRNARRHSSFSRTVPLEQTGPGGETWLVTEPSTAASQETTLLIREVETALLRLPQEQAEVVRLITIRGTSLEEAARTLGLPIGTVKSRLSRGHAALRHQLEHGPRTPQPSTVRQPRPRRSRTTGSAPEGSRPGTAALSCAA